MNKLNIFIYTVSLVAATCLAGCTKENHTNDNAIRITIAEYKGETKSYINGFFTEWENGDAVVLGVNNAAGISADLNITYPLGSMTATTSAAGFTPATGDDVWGAYPASLFSGKALGESVAITLPASYDYVTAFGHQTLAAPMVGYVKKTAGVDELVFRHACAILKITVAAATAYTLDEIQLVATNSAGDTNIQLSGGTTVNCQTGALGAWTSGSSANNTITLDMSGNRAALNEDRSFYVPVPPLASGTKIKIRLHNYEDGNWKEVSATTSAAIAGHTLSSFNPISVTGGTTDYEFYDYLINYYNDGSDHYGDAVIDLRFAPDNSTKAEITFKPIHHTNSQYYAGLAPFTFGISGSTHNRCLRTHFQGDIVQSSIDDANPDKITPNEKDINRDIAGSIYRVTLEVKQRGATTKYYSTTTFEEISGGSAIKIMTKDSKNDHEGGLNGVSSTFCLFSAGSSINPGMKLYSFRVWKNGVLLHNLVPAKCVKSGDPHENEFGLYDMVDKTFKVKTSGSGQFTAGNGIP